MQDNKDRSELIVKTEESQVLIVIAARQIRVLPNKAIVQSKRDRVCQVVSKCKCCSKAISLLGEASRRFEMFIEQRWAELGIRNEVLPIRYILNVVEIV